LLPEWAAAASRAYFFITARRRSGTNSPRRHFPASFKTSCGGVGHVAERWDYPIPQALQRHTGCRFVPPARRPLPEPVSPSPSTAPDPADPADAADPLRQKAETGTPD
jgi:hypothetical protein